MRKMREMSRSPAALVRMAFQAAGEALPKYSHRFSKRVFTQHQIFAILVLKAFFRTDYRGIVAILEDCKDLRKEMGLNRVPHFSTLWHAEKRLLKKGVLTYSRRGYFDGRGGINFCEVIDGPLWMQPVWRRGT